MSLGDAAAPSGGPAKRMEKLKEETRAPPEIREFMDSGGRLNILRRTDLSLACVSSGIKCWGLFCDFNMLPHFPPTVQSVLRWSAFFPPERTFRMYLAHLVKARQLNDCDATSWFTDRAQVAALGLSKVGDCSFVARPAVSTDQLRQPVKTFSLQDEFTLLAAICWIFLLRIKAEAIPMRRMTPTENMSEIGQADSHPVLGMVGSCLALKLCRSKHMASGSILKRSCCCQGRDRGDEDLHIPQLLCPVCSIWPVVRDRVVVGELIFPSPQSRSLIRHLREGSQSSLARRR